MKIKIIMLIPLVMILGVSSSLCDDEATLNQIWQELQDIQTKYGSFCGNIVETRRSVLLKEPQQFKGKFVAKNPDMFLLEYTEPESVIVLFNKDYVNVSIRDEGFVRTEVIDIKDKVSRAQKYFSGPESDSILRKDFSLSVSEDEKNFIIRMLPKARRFRGRVNYVVVWLDKDTMLINKLEIDGKSGVNSVFEIEITELNPELDDEIFKIYRPR